MLLPEAMDYEIKIKVLGIGFPCIGYLLQHSQRAASWEILIFKCWFHLRCLDASMVSLVIDRIVCGGWGSRDDTPVIELYVGVQGGRGRRHIWILFIICLIPLRQGLPLNKKLTTFVLGWKPERPSNPSASAPYPSAGLIGTQFFTRCWGSAIRSSCLHKCSYPFSHLPSLLLIFFLKIWMLFNYICMHSIFSLPAYTLMGT